MFFSGRINHKYGYDDFIAAAFEMGKFEYYEPVSVQKIDTKFMINTYGETVEVMARNSDKKLAQEAIRIIDKLPPMKPGKQGDTPINGTYSLPIYFQVKH